MSLHKSWAPAASCGEDVARIKARTCRLRDPLFSIFSARTRNLFSTPAQDFAAIAASPVAGRVPSLPEFLFWRTSAPTFPFQMTIVSSLIGAESCKNVLTRVDVNHAIGDKGFFLL